MSLMLVREVNSILKPRLGYLDALRGFAAFYVVLYHISKIPKPALHVPSFINAFVSFGGSGVILFFIISGFSMALTWGHHVNTGAPFRSFYIARFFRIAPLFYFWLILTLLRDFLFKGEAGLHSVNEVAANTLFLFNFYEPFQSGIVWASWTIGVEMAFYFVFPLIATYLGTTLLKSTIILLCSLGTVIFLRGSVSLTAGNMLLNSMLSGVGFLYILPTFLFGVVVFYFHEWIDSSMQSKFRRPVSFLFAILSIGGLIALIAERPNGPYWHFATSAFYGILLLSFTIKERNFVINPSSIYLGKISYSLYLNHPNIVYLLAPIYGSIYNLAHSAEIKFLLSVLMTALILVPLSHFTFRFIEQPFIRIGKNLNVKHVV